MKRKRGGSNDPGEDRNLEQDRNTMARYWSVVMSVDDPNDKELPGSKDDCTQSFGYNHDREDKDGAAIQSARCESTDSNDAKYRNNYWSTFLLNTDKDHDQEPIIGAKKSNLRSNFPQNSDEDETRPSAGHPDNRQPISAGPSGSDVNEHTQNVKCPYCSVTIKWKRNLSAHIKIVHEGRKDFKCSECDSFFGTKSNLDKHFNTVHGNLKPFECPFCDKSLAFRYMFRNHLRKHHPDQAVVDDVGNYEILTKK